jgi:hypothetical protein
MDSDDYYNPRLKHSFEYQEMFSRLRYTTDTTITSSNTLPLWVSSFRNTKWWILYWWVFQCEKYFGHNKLQINEFLKIPKSIQTHITKKYGEILKERTTSHIRRGDYAKLPNHHPMLSMDYYNEAIEILKKDTLINL